ncbi:MAG: glycosyltransferase [Christensenellales bacterium]|jgi:glycosyltransferase involved in cell wall biosynthesis
MRILIITYGFFPGKKYGGPPVSIYNMTNLIGTHQFYIVARNHDLGEKKPYNNVSEGWNRDGNRHTMYLTNSDYKGSVFTKIMGKIKPDLIYLQSLFQSSTAPCLYLAWKRNIPVLLAPRGELLPGAMRKKWKKVPYIFVLRILGLFKNAFYQATSQDEAEAIVQWLGVRKERIFQLPNVPVVIEDDYNNEQRIPKIKGVAKLVFLSRIVVKKNLLFALEVLKEVKSKVSLDVYGPIEDEAYWAKCKEMISTLPPNISVKHKGVIEHRLVVETLRKYDAFLFPTFSENYGHVIIEALSASCLAIISDQTPWNDLFSYGAGWVLSLSNPKKFTQAIEEVAGLNEDEMSKRRRGIRAYVQNKLDIPNLRLAYQNTFSVVAGENHNKE